MKTWRALARFLWPYRGRFLLGLVLGVIGSLLDGLSFVLLIPFLRAVFGSGVLSSVGAPAGSGIERFLDRLLGPLLEGATASRAFAVVVLLILVSVILKNLCVYVSRLYSLSLQEYVVRDMRTALYRHLQGMRLDYFQRTRGGQLLTRMLAATDR